MCSDVRRPEHRVVLAGIDTLALSWCVSAYMLADAEWAALARAKARAQEGDADAMVVLRGRAFGVAPRGANWREYALANGSVSMQLASDARDGVVTPEITVTFRAAALWQRGADVLVDDYRAWLSGWAVTTREMVTRADLAVDVAGPSPDEVDIRREVVSLARKRTRHGVLAASEHAQSWRWTGYTVGGGALHGRVYDKVAEIAVHRDAKGWFRELWAQHGWDGESPVTRVEFQARRDWLREHGIETYGDLRGRLADLWCYYTGDWLRLVRRGRRRDENNRRWPVLPFWAAAQSGTEGFGVPTHVVARVQRAPSEAAIVRQIGGLLVSLAAYRTADYAVTTDEADLRHAARVAKMSVGRTVAELLSAPASVDARGAARPSFDARVRERTARYMSFSVSERGAWQETLTAPQRMDSPTLRKHQERIRERDAAVERARAESREWGYVTPSERREVATAVARERLARRTPEDMAWQAAWERAAVDGDGDAEMAWLGGGDLSAWLPDGAR